MTVQEAVQAILDASGADTFQLETDGTHARWEFWNEDDYDHGTGSPDDFAKACEEFAEAVRAAESEADERESRRYDNARRGLR